MRVQGVELANKDGTGGKSDPFLKLLALPAKMKLADYETARNAKDDTKPKEYKVDLKKTEVINNEPNPQWKEFEVDMDQLIACYDYDASATTAGIKQQSDVYLDTKFLIECWDHDRVTTNDEIGWIVTTVRQLCSMQPLILKDRTGGNTPKPGSLEIIDIKIESKEASKAEAKKEEVKK